MLAFRRSEAGSPRLVRNLDFLRFQDYVHTLHRDKAYMLLKPLILSISTFTSMILAYKRKFLNGFRSAKCIEQGGPGPIS
jgi:hypothetical protein